MVARTDVTVIIIIYLPQFSLPCSDAHLIIFFSEQCCSYNSFCRDRVINRNLSHASSGDYQKSSGVCPPRKQRAVSYRCSYAYEVYVLEYRYHGRIWGRDRISSYICECDTVNVWVGPAILACL